MVFARVGYYTLFYFVYTWILSVKLLETKVGCNVNNVFINHMMYEDDTVIAPSTMAMYEDDTVIAPSTMAMYEDDTVIAPSTMAMYEDDTVIAPSTMAMYEDDTVIAPSTMAMYEDDTVIAPSPMAMYEDDTVIAPSPMAMYEDDTVIAPSTMAMYEDDTVIAPSTMAFQILIDCCVYVGASNDIIFNQSKSKCMYIKSKKYNNLPQPEVYLHDQVLTFVEHETYLDVAMSDNCTNDRAITRQIRSLYARDNLIIRNFKHYSNK